MCQESAKFPSLFFSTRSPGRFLPPDDVALLILIGTKITSIFPFSTVFCTYYTTRDEGGGDAPALALHRRLRVAAFPSRTHHTQFRRIFGTDQCGELHLRNVRLACVYLLTCHTQRQTTRERASVIAGSVRSHALTLLTSVYRPRLRRRSIKDLAHNATAKFALRVRPSLSVAACVYRFYFLSANLALCRRSLDRRRRRRRSQTQFTSFHRFRRPDGGGSLRVSFCNYCFRRNYSLCIFFCNVAAALFNHSVPLRLLRAAILLLVPLFCAENFRPIFARARHH